VNTAQAEKALIARLILDPDLTASVEGLEAEDFSVPDMATIYRVIRRRAAEGEAIDAVLVGEESGVDVDVLTLSPASFAPVEQYVKAIRDSAVRRSLSAILEQARSRILAKSDDDPVESVNRALDQIARQRGISGVRGAREVVRSYRDELYRRASVGDGIAYGIAGLDSTLLPMRAGRLVVFASRPGIGKTALAESVSDNAARFGPVLFVSLEMTAEELTDRAMARMSGLSAADIMRGKVEVEKLDDHLKARADAPIVYVDEGGTTTADIDSAVQKVKLTHDGKISLVIVDYLQLVADKGENEVYRVGGISHALKRLAMKHRVPVLALAQLNRNIESEGRKPRLSDLRDSGAIEQDADVVMIMQGMPYRPERQLHVLKQRQGKTGEIPMLFDGDTQRWSSPAVAASVF
jgi:replicative DNA helicase